jgi:hypothetical protein
LKPTIGYQQIESLIGRAIARSLISAIKSGDVIRTPSTGGAIPVGKFKHQHA